MHLDRFVVGLQREVRSLHPHSPPAHSRSVHPLPVHPTPAAHHPSHGLYFFNHTLEGQFRLRVVPGHPLSHATLPLAKSSRRYQPDEERCHHAHNDYWHRDRHTGSLPFCTSCNSLARRGKSPTAGGTFPHSSS